MGKQSSISSFEFVIIHRLDFPQLPLILDAIGSPGREWQDRMETIMKDTRAELNRLRKGLDKFHVDEAERKRLADEEEIEDADAAAYKARSEADIAELSAKVAELQAKKTLSDAEATELEGMIEELATAVGLPPEEEEGTETTDETETGPTTDVPAAQ